jgi:hypothetical protein
MRFNFKKISAIATSVLLTGMTVGIAAAANYPAPFVSGSSADVAIVYGTGAGVSSLDQVEATNIQSDLGVSGLSVVSGGEAFVLEKSSNNFNFQDALNGVYSDLGSEELDFLADGTYDDGDVDEDYEQLITLGTKTLTLFADTDYEDDAPTVGFKFDNADEILRYEIEFDDVVNYTEMVDTEMPMLGKEYYVLAASSSQIDVLDSAEKVTISDGETITFQGKQVSIEYIDNTDVKLKIDGESTDKLGEHDYEELSDGSYVVINENLYEEKEVGISKAVISIGAGKMELIDADEVQINDEDVDGLEVDITDATGLSKLELIWKSDRETFLTSENAIVMPGFGEISLSFGGLDYESDSEVVQFQNGETLTIGMDNFDLPVMWFNSSEYGFLGEEDNPLIVNTSNITNTTWTDAGSYPDLLAVFGKVYSGNVGLTLSEDDRFIVTRVDTDLSDCQTMYYQVNTVENDSGDILVELEDLIGSNDITLDAIETDEVGDITVQLLAINGSTAGKAYVNFSAGSDTITYNKVVSDKGLVITIPTNAATTVNTTGAVFALVEANKDEDVGAGTAFTVTVKNTSNDKLHVSTHNLTSYDEDESDDNYIGMVPSDLASKFSFDTSADEYDFEVEYFGKEATAQVTLTVGGSVETSAGVMVVKDSEVSSVSGKNLIVVGGSCINSVAASILGGSLCGSSFTSATGVGSGQYLIESVASPLDSSKVALLVAGYEAADTQAASAYLRTQTVDTTVGKKGVGTTGVAGTITFE